MASALVSTESKCRTEGQKTLNAADTSILEGKLAGAVGFEPTPSALTVRCPTGWTTPQQIKTFG